MKSHLILLLILSFSFIISQEKSDREVRDEIEKKNEMMKKAWEEFAAPDANHESLNFIAGSWKTALNVYDGKGNVFRKGTGTCESRWILGKRFLFVEHNFPLYRAIGVLGYNKYSKKFVSAYADNQGTGVYKSQGSKQQDGSLSLEGPSISYATGKPIQARYVYSNSDKGYTFTIYNVSEKTPVKILDITYTKSTEDENKVFWTKKQDVTAENEKEWSDYAKVTQKHKNLDSLVGEWKATYLIYDDAGNVIRAPEGVASNRSVLGGRFVVLHYKLDEYKAFGVMGYDNSKQKYISLYVDTSGTAINTREGDSKDKKLFTLQGESIDYATGKPMTLTSQTKITNSKRYSFKLFDQKEKDQLNIVKVHMQCDRKPEMKDAKKPEVKDTKKSGK